MASGKKKQKTAPVVEKRTRSSGAAALPKSSVVSHPKQPPPVTTTACDSKGHRLVKGRSVPNSKSASPARKGKAAGLQKPSKQPPHSAPRATLSESAAHDGNKPGNLCTDNIYIGSFRFLFNTFLITTILTLLFLVPLAESSGGADTLEAPVDAPPTDTTVLAVLQNKNTNHTHNTTSSVNGQGNGKKTKSIVNHEGPPLKKKKPVLSRGRAVLPLRVSVAGPSAAVSTSSSSTLTGTTEGDNQTAPVVGSVTEYKDLADKAHSWASSYLFRHCKIISKPAHLAYGATICEQYMDAHDLHEKYDPTERARLWLDMSSVILKRLNKKRNNVGNQLQTAFKGTYFFCVVFILNLLVLTILPLPSLLPV